MYDGTYTLSGSALHAALQRGSTEPEVPTSFDGILAEDGSFTSAQLSGGGWFQNYVRSAAVQKELEQDCERLYNLRL